MLYQRIKFRHLQCFLEVARQKSVVKASEILNITQPAVSKTIRELEETLEVKLFDRSKRGASLTRFGEVFLRYAGTSVSALRQGVDSIEQAREKGGMTITIGILPTVAARVMPAAVRAFKADGMETTVRIVTGYNTVLLSQLRVGDLDLVVGRLSSPDLMIGLTFEHLYSEKVGFLVRAGHPLLAERPFDLARIRDYTVLVPPPGAAIQPYVERLLIVNGIGSLPDTVETVSPAFGRKYLRESDAVWAISTGVVADDIADGLLVELPVETEGTTGPVGLTTRADAPPGLATQMLMQAVREVAAKFGGSL
jgi:LysR family pca operon transcriptional activator